jgi:hypothetical protein
MSSFKVRSRTMVTNVDWRKMEAESKWEFCRLFGQFKAVR